MKMHMYKYMQIQASTHVYKCMHRCKHKQRYAYTLTYVQTQTCVQKHTQTQMHAYVLNQPLDSSGEISTVTFNFISSHIHTQVISLIQLLNFKENQGSIFVDSKFVSWITKIALPSNHITVM